MAVSALIAAPELTGHAYAAATQAYTTTIKPTGNSDVDGALTSSSDLLGLQKTKAVSPFALAGRIRSDYSRLNSALESFGYYAGSISLRLTRLKASGPGIDGKDAGLADWLSALPDGEKPVITISATLGPLFHIGVIRFVVPTPPAPDAQPAAAQTPAAKAAPQTVAAKGLPGKSAPAARGNAKTSPASGSATPATVPASEMPGTASYGAPPPGAAMPLTPVQINAFGLKSGDPAVASAVLGAASSLSDELREEGHALANVDQPTAWLRPETHTVDLSYPVTIGPVAHIGPISLSGLDRMHPAFIHRRLTVAPGALYQPSRIENARQDLASLGVFSTVGVKDAPRMAADGKTPTLAPDGTMPLAFNFQESKRRAIGVQGGYSTDLGGRAGVDWTHYNLFGNAERLKLTALVTGLGGSAQQGLGYDVYADLMKPDFPGRDQNASVRVEGLRQVFYSYRQTALLARVGIARKLSKRWNVSYGLAAEEEQITQFGVTRDYTLAFIPLSANFDNTDVPSPIEPATHGFRVSLNVTPTASLVNGTSFFTLLEGNASTYFDFARFGLTAPGRSVLAFRVMVGSVQGASTYAIPPDQRLYAGGSATVRGFRYQGVGPQYGNSKYAIGGTSIDAGTIEFRQRILKSFGAAAFIDAGQVGTGSAPFEDTLRVGAGAGARYYTPIGPVRIDVAVPLNRPPRGDKWELYIGLGETF